MEVERAKQALMTSCGREAGGRGRGGGAAASGSQGKDCCRQELVAPQQPGSKERHPHAAAAAAAAPSPPSPTHLQGCLQVVDLHAATPSYPTQSTPTHP